MVYWFLISRGSIRRQNMLVPKPIWNTISSSINRIMLGICLDIKELLFIAGIRKWLLSLRNI